MHFHVPKPLHGWRAFTGEVGIIVIGVLIALASSSSSLRRISNNKRLTRTASFEASLTSISAD